MSKLERQGRPRTEAPVVGNRRKYTHRCLRPLSTTLSHAGAILKLALLPSCSESFRRPSTSMEIFSIFDSNFRSCTDDIDGFLNLWLFVVTNTVVYPLACEACQGLSSSHLVKVWLSLPRSRHQASSPPFSSSKT